MLLFGSWNTTADVPTFVLVHVEGEGEIVYRVAVHRFGVKQHELPFLGERLKIGIYRFNQLGSLGANLMDGF